mmetsp:Transcript_41966/g.113166  ORF Transcript_41966/g.113166 Transcript_41966/m.113166 type:complete len:99 (-) Transcript_41966:43-339(-)
MLRPESEIHRLVVAAYERQLEILDAQPKRGPEHAELIRDVRRELAKVKGNIFSMLLHKAKPADGKAEGATAGASSLSAEQRERIECMRRAALERRCLA